MRALGTAVVVLSAVFVASPAQASRLIVEYSCRGEAPGVQVAAKGDKIHPRLLQARVRHAVFSGRCKIVRYRAPRRTKVAIRAVKPQPPKKTTISYVPATRAVQPVRVSYVHHYNGYSGTGRFPGPPLFLPVR